MNKIDWKKILEERRARLNDPVSIEMRDELGKLDKILDKILNKNISLLEVLKLTEGEKIMSIGTDRVRVKFNPSSHDIVDEIKQKTADLIDLCESLKRYDIRLAFQAQTVYEEAAMWAVKAATTEIPVD